MKCTYNTINDHTREATLHLYGTIGTELDGNQFARELAGHDQNSDLIKIRINSPGGDVFQGMSIVSAILSMKTSVHVYIDGVAASMAAVIAVCAEKVYMQDFAKLMIHDPSFKGNFSANEKENNMLSRVRDMLLKVLSRRGKDESEVSGLMSEETWFSADEAKANGLCDEILPSATPELKALTPVQIIAKINAQYPAPFSGKSLANNILTILGLSHNATPNEVSEAVICLHNKAVKAERRLAELESGAGGALDKPIEVENAVKLGFIDQSQSELFRDLYKTNPARFHAFMNERKAEDAGKVEGMLVQACRAGKFAYQEREIFETIGKELGANALKSLLDSIAGHVPTAPFITGTRDITDRTKWGLDEYRKFAPQELKNNPELYARLVDKNRADIMDSVETLEYYRKHDPEYLKAHPEAFEKLVSKNQSKR